MPFGRKMNYKESENIILFRNEVGEGNGRTERPAVGEEYAQKTWK